MILDQLRRPIAVGDTILTKGYSSSTTGTLATVIRVNRETVTFSGTKTYWHYDTTLQKRALITEPTLIRRRGDECIVVNEQLAYNRDTYPEYQL